MPRVAQNKSPNGTKAANGIWLRIQSGPHTLCAEFRSGPERTTFQDRRDLHPDLRADYVLANLRFNPAARGTNFAWVQHFIHHLALDGIINGRQTLN